MRQEFHIPALRGLEIDKEKFWELESVTILRAEEREKSMELIEMAANTYNTTRTGRLQAFLAQYPHDINDKRGFNPALILSDLETVKAIFAKMSSELNWENFINWIKINAAPLKVTDILNIILALPSEAANLETIQNIITQTLPEDVSKFDKCAKEMKLWIKQHQHDQTVSIIAKTLENIIAAEYPSVF